MLELRITDASDPSAVKLRNDADHVVFDGITLVDFLAAVYHVSEFQVRGVSPAQDRRFALELVGQKRGVAVERLLAAGVEAAFGFEVDVRKERRRVVVMRGGVDHTGPRATVLKAAAWEVGPDWLECASTTIDGVAAELGHRMREVVVNETGLKGSYRVKLVLPPSVLWGSEEALELLGGQLGLALAWDDREVLAVNVKWAASPLKR